MHRSVLMFCGIALTIASQYCLLGCASRSSAPATQEPPLHDTSVRVDGADQAISAPTSELRSLPLHKAVEQLVPANYAVRWIDIDPSQRKETVTWNANQEWQVAIAQAIAGAEGLTVDIGNASRLVLIRHAAPRIPRTSTALLTLPATVSAVSPVAITPTRTKKAIGNVPAGAQARVEGVVRIQPVGIRVGITPEPVVTNSRSQRLANRWELSERDKTLKGAVERWAQDSGWHAFWELDVDYPIAASASIDGDFEEAVSAVVRSMDHADVPLKAIFYRGNQVLRMVPRGME